MCDEDLFRIFILQLLKKTYDPQSIAEHVSDQYDQSTIGSQILNVYGNLPSS